MNNNFVIEKDERINRLIENLYKEMPVVESARAVLLTESYKHTENEPIILRRAKAFSYILKNLPIVIRDEELIVGASTISQRGCQTFPEFSYKWLEDEFETLSTRNADPFFISDQTKVELKKANSYWEGKTTSELATAFMAPEAKRAIEHNIFTPGNYFYNGVGHVTVKYDKILQVGFKGIMEEASLELYLCNVSDADYVKKSNFLKAVIISCKAAIDYAERYSLLASKMADECNDINRKTELKQISQNCKNVPLNGAKTFYEACQSFWFVQQLLQVESSGHSISPGRFDQYMYPYLKNDLDNGKIDLKYAQLLLDSIWVKLNSLNKCRDAASAEGFAGYSLFQNLIVGGQDSKGKDATNELSYMCIEASMHTQLPQPSLSIRVWNNSPHDLLIKAATLTRTGIGLPAYYNDEVIISSLMNRGLTLEDARDYNIIGCVEPQKAGKTDGWHDAAFFNMCRPLELVFSNGIDNGEQISIKTGEIETITSFEQFYEAYKKQMLFNIELMVNADNSIDVAHAERCPLPFLSGMIDDCMKRGKSVQEGGAVYNFTGPQGFGIANMADSLIAVKKLVFDEKKLTLKEFKEALDNNYGKTPDNNMVKEIGLNIINTLQAKGEKLSEAQIKDVFQSVIKSSQNVKSKYDYLLNMIEEIPKFGNDNNEVDEFARDVAYTYTRPLQNYKNPRGGVYQAGLYPVSANVPLGAQTGATPDGRLKGKPVADGVSPSAGKDIKGPTAAANSVSKLDHYIASNGTLFNQKFHPSALSGRNGLENFVALIRSYFDQKGSHMQFNVVSKETLIDAQKNPDNYKHLVVRVAGYSAMFTSLSRSLQDDIINRTEQGLI
jgi:formate C-acetyltransferase